MYSRFMPERHGISQGIAVIIRRQNPDTQQREILLSLRAKGLRYMGGYWSLPVGHVEPLESPSRAMSREIKEELGGVVQSSKLNPKLTVHTAPEEGEGPEGQRTDTYFEVAAADIEGQLQNLEPDRCDEIRWFPQDMLPDNFMPRQLSALDYIASGRTYVEEGWRA